MKASRDSETIAENASALSPLLETGLLRATEAAAIAASDFIGRGDERAADMAAVEAMRTVLSAMAMRGRVVIGEGERDAAPMLYIGEELGSGDGMAVDIAVDPLEGTTLTAKAMSNALTVAALGASGALLHAPDVYMEKIVIGRNDGEDYPPNLISLDAEIGDTIGALAKAKGVKPKKITACALDRPRHDALIRDLRKAGAALHLITDGDIAAAIHAAAPSSPIDIYVGIGGAPEGVLAAAALACLGGQMQGRLVFSGDEQRRRAETMGITDASRIYNLSDMVRGGVLFAASGVTSGSLLDGVARGQDGSFSVNSLLLSSASGEARRIHAHYPPKEGARKRKRR